MKLIAKGSEADIYVDEDRVIKDRIKKSYRLDCIDSELRKTRTKSEFGLMKKCAEAGVNVPTPIRLDGEYKEIMVKIDGDPLDSVFASKRMQRVGEEVAKMHAAGVVHGDLTTSNMLVKDEDIFIIDFGLSSFSKKEEDRATDVFLLKNALKSRHYKERTEAFEIFMSAYAKRMGKEFKGIQSHLKDIERRRRYHEDN
jgi:Kae1-associated kinase Bud32